MKPILFLSFLWMACHPCSASEPRTGSSLPSKSDVLSIMRRVCDWQLQNLPEYRTSRNIKEQGKPVKIAPNGWIRGAFFTGVMATYETTKDSRYLEAAIAWAEKNAWQIGPKPRLADDQAVAQTYLEIFRIKKDPRMTANILKVFDEIAANPMRGPVVGWKKDTNWNWCDALFMAPPVYARLAAITGKRNYLEAMDQLWADTTDYLYDPAEHLYFRDESFIPKPDDPTTLEKNGKKIFWSRGNGWVMGGLVRVLQSMPKNYSTRQRYMQQFKEMAGKIAALQGQDGLWRASLLDPGSYPDPETSGSSFFCYAMAWGINQGVLNKKEYLPLVEKAWKGLVEMVEPSGKLTWVQLVGAAPAKVFKEDTVEYAAGAFLLAGSEVIKLRR